MPMQKDGTYLCKRCGWTNLTWVDRCRACNRAKKKLYYAKNPEKRVEERKRYRSVHPEVGKRNRVAWKKKNRASVNRTARNYYSSNPELRRQKEASRRRNYTAGDVTAAQLREIVRLAESKCHYCLVLVECRCLKGHPKGFDHVLAFANGGKHTASNIVVCCRSCNVKKGLKQTP